MIYLHIVSERLTSVNCLNNTERLFKSDAETRGSFVHFHNSAPSWSCLCSDVRCCQLWLWLGQAQPGSGSYSSSSLFSPERILCSSQPCFGSQCNWEAVEKNERALGAGGQAGEGLLKEGDTTVLEGQRGTARRDGEIASARKRGSLMEGTLRAGRRGWVQEHRSLRKKFGRDLKTVFINHEK